MIIKSAEFVTSAVKAHQYPSAMLPEIAFAGRSNVGKSSLINTLLNRKHLVKTSNTPGRTQLINFFAINKAFCFVDLPGYGYAKVPKAVKESWGPMIETYLATRDALKGVVLIMDMRRVPGHEEINFIDWLAHQQLASILVLTKADKLSTTARNKQHLAIADKLAVDKSHLIRFSSKTRSGKEAVWEALERLIDT